MQDKTESEEKAVNRVDKQRQKVKHDQKKRYAATSTESKPRLFSKKCYFCGKDFHKRELCPAKNVVCNNCGKKGHLKAVCKSSKVHEVQSDEMPGTSENSIFLGAVLKGKTNPKDWTVDVCVDNTEIKFKVDTGADVDIISDDVYRKYFSHKYLLSWNKNIKGPEQKSLPILGYIKCFISKGDQSTKADIYVMKGGTTLLGRESSVAFGIVALIYDVQSYLQLFKGLGEMLYHTRLI